MDPKTLTHKALDRSDDVGAFIAAVVGLCGILHLPEKWGLTSDDLAMILGFGFTIIAFARGRLENAYKAFLTGGRFTGPSAGEEASAPADEPAVEPETPADPPSSSPTLPPPPAVGPKG